MDAQVKQLDQSSIYRYNVLYPFAIIVSLHILLSFLFSRYVMNEGILFSYYGQQLSVARVSEIIALGKKWVNAYFAFMPVMFFVKFLLTAAVIAVGLIIVNEKFSFGKLLKVVIVAEFIFILSFLIRIIYFLYIKTDYTYEDLNTFLPLSLLNLFDPSTIDKPWHYPLQVANLFEVLYIVFISYFLKYVIDSDFTERLKIVSVTYLSGLLVWTLFAIFIFL